MKNKKEKVSYECRVEKKFDLFGLSYAVLMVEGNLGIETSKGIGYTVWEIHQNK